MGEDRVEDPLPFMENAWLQTQICLKINQREQG